MITFVSYSDLMLATTAQYLMDCLNFARCILLDQLVFMVCMQFNSLFNQSFLGGAINLNNNQSDIAINWAGKF